MFVAPDQGALLRLEDSVRTALAWGSIIKDIETRRLNIDGLQEDQARKALENAEKIVPSTTRECFKWLLCPMMATATDRQATVEAFALNTSGGSWPAEIDRVCQENELVITTWSPIHLRNTLRELYWKDAAVAVRAMAVWEDMQKYLYLPRLARRDVLEQAIVKGAATRDFFGTAYGQTGDRFEGFRLGDPNVQLDDTLLLLEPSAAAAYEAAQRKADPASSVDTGGEPAGSSIPGTPTPTPSHEQPGFASTVPTHGRTPPRARAFFGSVEVGATTAKIKLISIADEIIAVLASDPNANVRVTVEVSAEFPEGVSDSMKRVVSENAAALGFKLKNWD